LPFSEESFHASLIVIEDTEKDDDDDDIDELETTPSRARSVAAGRPDNFNPMSDFSVDELWARLQQQPPIPLEDYLPPPKKARFMLKPLPPPSVPFVSYADVGRVLKNISAQSRRRPTPA
jgi:hypothetical protein